MKAYPDVDEGTVPNRIRNAAIGAAKAGISFNLREALYGAPRGVGKRITEQYSGFENAMKAIAESVFTKEQIAELKRADVDPRHIYEIAGTSAQCGNVIGKVDATTPCWICGLRIQYGGPGMEPGQCEHVLPIIQAVMFLGLYSQGRGDEIRAKGLEYDPKEDPALQLEYRYAHETCNLVKNDINFINVERIPVWPHEQFVVRTGAVQQLLRDIWDSTYDYKYAGPFRAFLHASYEKNRTRFITTRTAAMVEHLEKITAYLNAADAPGLVKLRALANLVGSPMHPKAEPLLKGDFTVTRVPEPPTLVKPSLFYSALTKVLEKELLSEAKVLLGLSSILRDVAKDLYPAVLPTISTVEGQTAAVGDSIKKRLLLNMIEKLEESITAIRRSGAGAERLLTVVNVLLATKYAAVEEWRGSVGGAGTTDAGVTESDGVLGVIEEMRAVAPEEVAAEEARIDAMLLEELMALKSAPMNTLNGNGDYNSNSNGAVNLLMGLGRTVGGFRKTRKRRASRRRRKTNRR